MHCTRQDNDDEHVLYTSVARILNISFYIDMTTDRIAVRRQIVGNN